MHVLFVKIYKAVLVHDEILSDSPDYQIREVDWDVEKLGAKRPQFFRF